MSYGKSDTPVDGTVTLPQKHWTPTIKENMIDTRQNGSNDSQRKGLPLLFLFAGGVSTRVHTACPDGEAKHWLEPHLELAKNYNLSRTQLKEIESIVEVHYEAFRRAWQEHLSS
jgi:hypothetical protein